MKIWITGANGFLGQHLCRQLSVPGYSIYAIARGSRRIPYDISVIYHDLELTNVSVVQDRIQQVSPDVIIHTAAMSKPDECLQHPEACIEQNVTVTANLLAACKHSSTHFVHLSTDFIFGENGPHSENDIPDPLNFYGVSKLMAEEKVKESGLDYTIVRPVFIYGQRWEGLRPSFIQWVHQQLLIGKPLQIVTDQLRTPTFVNDLCAGIAHIIKYRKKGVYHIAGADIISPYSMALTVANALQLDASLIRPVTADFFPEPVIRAKKSGLQITKAINELGFQPTPFERAVHSIFNLSSPY